jgi:catechol 2,3-dioxygenase-like lactoylglutathione lyase family enzyme/DNA-dependent RNA polymerase auxiliary subunit epsilon
MPNPNSKTTGDFEIRGINHLALVCKDMAKTVDFYTNVLGFPLIKTLDLPNGMGQHFFFDIGNGDSLAFFWFPDAPDAAPGVASPDTDAFFDPRSELVTAHASMNHVAFDVAPDEIEGYRTRLEEKGVRVTPIMNHDASPSQVSMELTESTFVRSIYFFDPDGICLEFAAWTKVFTPEDVEHAPATEHDKERYIEAQREGAARRRADKEARNARVPAEVSGD